MRQATFITGFNNWGKTTIIQSLFNNRHRYYYGARYTINGVNVNTEFTVESHSNDDYWGYPWIELLEGRINRSPDNGENLFSALCPTLEDENNFVELLSNRIFQTYDRLNIFLIEYKWEHNAKLIIENIEEQGQLISNVNFIRINADENLNLDGERRNAKLQQIQAELQLLF